MAPAARSLIVALLAPVVVACGGHTAGGEPIEPSPDDRYVVSIRDESGRDAIERAGGTILSELPDQASVVVQIDASLLGELAAEPAIAEVEADARRYPLATEIVPYGVSLVEATELAATAGTAGKIRVCVIDSGYERGHEDLPDAKGAPNGGAGDWYADGCGHGTHVAGTIAAVDNELGVIGAAAAAVDLHIVRVFRDDCRWSYASTLVAALMQCIRAGARVVNMSLGGTYPSLLEQRAFALAERRGLLSIAAAGNDGDATLNYPASYPSVVSVAALDESRVVAGFSQKNEHVELAAPGVGVLSTYAGAYAYGSGTSMATPHVSAVAALVWSHDQRWTNREIRSALAATALDLGPSGRDPAYGFGLVRAKAALEQLRGR